MNIEVALQRYKDVFLPDVIDNSQGDFLAKHVPMRNLLLIDHDEPTDNDKKNPLTEEDIYERVFSARDDDQFVLVKGASGAGKSHLIRWFESMLQIHKQDNEIVLYLRRADNTLKGKEHHVWRSTRTRNTTWDNPSSISCWMWYGM